MKHKIIGPFCDNFISISLHEPSEIIQFIWLQGPFARNRLDTYFLYFSIFYDDFRFRFISLIFAMDMNGFMLVAIEKYHDTQVCIDLWHTDISPRPNRTRWNSSS
uniref:Uncharacterized protein n=1 Tax=Candidatus Kentrum sp. LPFa TaxID=2126335 RepID=A0A450VZZ2_9GAMM|nr:MAG: hypothetical protein BECKLPF1236B_GA0070989_101320 [Candidatus Kentron sp. LPFa]